MKAAKKASRIMTVSRRDMLSKAAMDAKHYGRRLARRASEIFDRFGLTHSLPPEGDPEEKVALVPISAPLGRIVDAIRKGQTSVPVANLQQAVGGPLNSPTSLRRLARAGLALQNCLNGQAELAPSSPAIAEVVNLSRRGPGRKGFPTRKIVEAFAPGKPVSKLGPSRVLAAAAAMAQWGLNGIDLLERQRYTRVKSSWRIS